MNSLLIMLIAFQVEPSGEFASVNTGELSSMSAEDVKSRLQKMHDSLHSVHVDYEILRGDSEYPTDKSNVTVRRSVFVKRPDRLMCETLHQTRFVPFDDDPYSMCIYLNGSELIAFKKFQLEFSASKLEENKLLPEVASPGHYFRSTGLALLERVEQSEFPSIPEICRSAEFSKVRPFLESVNGANCHVLENSNGRDAVWIDVERAALIARERYTDQGVLAVRFDFLELQECAGQVWLPLRIRSRKLNPYAEKEEDRTRIYRETILTVRELSVNTVPDDVFNFVPPPGVIKEGKDLRDQIVPGGLEHMQKVSDWLTSYFQKTAKWNKTEANGQKWTPFLPPALAAFAIGLCELAARFRRVRKSDTRLSMK